MTFYKTIINNGQAVKNSRIVIPAYAGIQEMLKALDSGLRRNDERR